MSTKFKVTGYEGLNKVAMTKPFREHMGLNLKSSKDMTDKLLTDGLLEFEVEDPKKAKDLLHKLRKANANVSVSE